MRACRPEPCDDTGHGSHTTGTAVGGDGAGNEIGVAPGAKWIGCRNMDQGIGTPATYTECFQFFIAPTDLAGQNANPELRPHVINNSWQCPAGQGCAPETLRTIVENAEAAGIFVEAAVGSGGPSCSSVSDPPSIYERAFSTGAVDGSNALAGFGSRGPVTVDGSGRIKPDIVAPGVGVRSAVSSSDSSYSSFTGTSMAGPHVVGVVALLWSARPSLMRDIAATKQLLSSTANANVTVSNGTQCGGIDHVPNNHFGWGLVDALAAYNAAPPPPPPPPPPPLLHQHHHLRLRFLLLLLLPTTAADPTAPAASSGALPRAEGPRHEARAGQTEDPRCPVRRGPRSSSPFPTSGACPRPEPEIRLDSPPRFSGQARRRPALEALSSSSPARRNTARPQRRPAAPPIPGRRRAARRALRGWPSLP